MEAGRIIDISRLLSRLHRRTPTGIDRVEFAYARHYLNNNSDQDVRAVVTTPVNTGLLSRRTVRQLMQTAEARWSSSENPPSGPAWTRLCEILKSPISVAQPSSAIGADTTHDRSDIAARTVINRAYAESAINGFFGRLPARAQPSRGDPSWYLHVSHINLHSPARIRWVKSGRLRNVFMVHDLIPITHPEYFLPGEDMRHQTRMETIANLADLVIFNSRATQSAWGDFVAARQLPRPQGAVVPLGTEDVFLGAGPELNSEVPYFVVVGTLESRKNLSFLLHVWKSWIATSSISHSILVIIGRRGRHSENTTDLLDRSAVLAPTVVEIAEMADAGLAMLLRGARALLAPSLIEGFGLPIAEALALGVPVIASDTAAHREVGGDCAEYLDPLDGPAWRQALEDYAVSSSPRREAMAQASKRYRAMTWDNHIQSVEAILAGRS